MKSMVNEIVGLMRINTRIDRTAVSGFVGIVIVLLFWGACYWGVKVIINTVESSSIVALQEIVAVLCMVTMVIVVIFGGYYLIYYLLLLIITTIQFGLAPHFKDRANSIESLMTSEIEDKGRMHKGIVRYLSECSTIKHFAALHIWLCENQLLTTGDQSKFLNALTADFPNDSDGDNNKNKLRVPSPAAFSEQKTKLEGEDMKQYKEYGYKTLFEKRFRPFIRE